ncbi:DUF4381 domain-containing protein [Metapseudomonas furukawaii]|jgi:hypothetical protein|uniref:DUF4381 domain-containing protein n=1 Tax=Metapseudomonas furukawaii TaxID=1149133 RepID=A0AAD1C360_METFU|nr:MULTISPECIES: DUF4381 domain-containing protein [Pseudomonas]ELS28617.1 Hypothetical protein ppKF707_1703 [Pseudomonas furukawaii]OWJ91880.1 hypothetical protein B6S59_22570 [Pseudomonas sp. A46]WAG77211.1 DUF4381 domain-containing protein [Pseudomonas furukawaii]BAU75202.1 hypothetical protein KF707C_35140 [Pseudomonas furukawaii]
MNPLEGLEPLIAPPPIPWWPPAPGWWALPPLLALLAGALWYAWKRRTPERPEEQEPTLDPSRQAALEELARLPKPYDGAPAGPWLQELNGLLKRLCRIHYPGDQSHTLSGRAWLAYLDNRCPAAGLTRWMILVEGAYRPQCKLDDKAIQGLNQSVETWIRKHV